MADKITETAGCGGFTAEDGRKVGIRFDRVESFTQGIQGVSAIKEDVTNVQMIGGAMHRLRIKIDDFWAALAKYRREATKDD